MQKIKLSVFVLLFLIPTIQYAQVYNLYWDKAFGGDNRDWNTNIVTAADGSIYIIGDSQSGISGNKALPVCASGISNSDIWLMKVDTAGNILWQKDLGGDADERLPKLVPLNNASKQLLFSCQSSSGVACDKTEPNRDTVPIISTDYWICLLDSNGTKIWDKTLGGDNYDDYTQIAVLSNGEILVCGESNSDINGDKTVPNYSISNDYWAVKLDLTGTIIWDKVYGGTGAEFLSSIIPLPNGAFVLAGSTTSDPSGDVSEPGQGGQDYWMIKVDNAGNKILDKRLGGSDIDKCLNVSPTPDNGFIFSGYTVSPIGGDVSEAPKGVADYWIVKTDSAGNKQWDKRYGGTLGAYATCAAPALGGGYWVYGYTNSDAAGDVTQSPYGGSDYWIIRTDSAGTRLWDRRFGGSGNEYSSVFTTLADSSLLLFGYADTGVSATKTDFGYGWWDYWMVKFKYTIIGVGLNETANTLHSFEVVPNPSTGNIQLNYFIDHPGRLSIGIVDVRGKKCFEKEITSGSGAHNEALDLTGLDRGMYFVTIDAENGERITKKVILN
ncbi:MAG TPA: T9SS type A sorting domain-containing protein [Bacteroidia bacterium]|nr:T9SS type A sorting domain-containing protein [Bacteroidia bacterium]